MIEQLIDLEDRIFRLELKKLEKESEKTQTTRAKRTIRALDESIARRLRRISNQVR